MNKSTCIQCEKPIIGRSDKKFCDEYCRNSFNNKLKRKEEQKINAVNTLIRKNRRILRTLCPVGKATVRRDILESMGYQFRYFSSIYRSSQGLVYYVNYDYAFSPVRESQGIEKAIIVQVQEYFDAPYDPWRFIKSK